jgi:hypothetical protein
MARAAERLQVARVVRPTAPARDDVVHVDGCDRAPVAQAGGAQRMAPQERRADATPRGPVAALGGRTAERVDLRALRSNVIGTPRRAADDGRASGDGAGMRGSLWHEAQRRMRGDSRKSAEEIVQPRRTRYARAGVGETISVPSMSDARTCSRQQACEQ